MQFYDDELLLLSRGRRVSSGTRARLAAERLAQVQVRHDLARANSREDQPRAQLRVVSSRNGTASTEGLVAGLRSDSGGER